MFKKALIAAVVWAGLGACLSFGQSYIIPNETSSPTWTGVHTFVQSPIVPDPFTAFQAANKEYVDAHAGGSPGGSNQQLQFNNFSSFGGAAQATYNTSTNVLAAKLSANSSIIQNRGDAYDLYSDGGADPTGTTDASSLLTTACAGGKTVMLPAPGGSATYLLASAANLTASSTCTLQFANGAQITTGHQTPSTITSISRMTSIGSQPQVQLSLSGLGCQSSETTTTDVFTSCPNSFIAGETVKLAGLTNAKNCTPPGSGNPTTCTINSSGLSSTSFTVNITGGSTVASAAETGTASFDQGSVSIVSFASTLTGATVGGNVVCTGTTNFNGPYKIQAIADSTDYALRDFRAGAPTETAGSCYVPYTVTIKNPIIAGEFQQIVTANSAVTFMGQNTIYPGWYGAVGDGTTNDWLPLQETLFWNPGRDITAAKRNTSVAGGLALLTPDYAVNDTLQMYGSSQSFHGNFPTTWGGGVELAFAIPPGFGPGILMPIDGFNQSVWDMDVVQPSTYGGTAAAYNYYYFWPSTAGISNDGIAVQSQRAIIHDVQVAGWLRNGILVDGTYQGAANNIYGLAQPDYWHFTNIFTDFNRNYGVDVVGNDANAGSMDGGANDMRANFWGGINDMSQTGGLYSPVNGENNADLVLGAGTTQAISSISVTGSGASAVCSLTTSAALANNLQHVGVTGQNWITVAGTSVADGTWYSTNTNTGTNTITFPCAGSSGSASTGTVGTASSANIFALMNSTSNGFLSNNFTITGLFGGIAGTVVNPYCESTNGKNQPGGGMLVLGGALCEGNTNKAAGVFLYPSTSNLFADLAGLFLENPTGSLQRVVLNAGTTTLTSGSSQVDFENAGTNNFELVDLFETGGTDFAIYDLNPGDYQNVFTIESNGSGNQFLLNAPSTTAKIWFQSNIANNGNINFFNNGSAATTVFSETTGISTNGLIDTAITTTPSTSPICPNGTGGAFTTSGCSGGGGSTSGTVTYTTSHTLATGDNGLTVVMNCGSACNLTLPNPQPSTTFKVTVQTTNANTTVVLGSSMTFNSSASVPVLIPFENIGVSADSATTTNYVGSAPLKAGTNVLITAAANSLTVSASGGGGLSGMTAGQIPIAATATTAASSAPLQGTDSSILTAGTVSGTGNTLCTDANGGATTTGCAPGGGVNAGTAGDGGYYATSSSTISDAGTAATTFGGLKTANAGAASTNIVTLGGAIFTGGSGTTTFPYFTYQHSGTAPTTWNTAGTVIGLNADSGFVGNFLDFHGNGGASVFSVTYAGQVVGNSTISANTGFVYNTNFSAGNGTNGFKMRSDWLQEWSSTTANSGTIDTVLARAVPGTLEINAGTTAGATGSLNVATVNHGSSGVLGTDTFGNATSGTVTLEPVTGALGTVTVSLPAATGTIALTSQLDLSISPVALPTSSIGANTCTAATGSPFTATGVTTSMVVVPGFASDPSAVTGYGSSGGLSVNAYPAANAVNVKVCNSTASPITPGALTVNIRIIQ